MYFFNFNIGMWDLFNKMDYPQDLSKLDDEDALVTIRKSLRIEIETVVDEIFDRFMVNKLKDHHVERSKVLRKMDRYVGKLAEQTFDELHDKKYGFDITSIHRDYYQQCIHQSPIEIELNRLELWANLQPIEQ